MKFNARYCRTPNVICVNFARSIDLNQGIHMMRVAIFSDAATAHSAAARTAAIVESAAQQRRFPLLSVYAGVDTMFVSDGYVTRLTLQRSRVLSFHTRGGICLDAGIWRYGEEMKYMKYRPLPALVTRVLKTFYGRTRLVLAPDLEVATFIEQEIGTRTLVMAGQLNRSIAAGRPVRMMADAAFTSIGKAYDTAVTEEAERQSRCALSPA
jgi:hypothetical protein